MKKAVKNLENSWAFWSVMAFIVLFLFISPFYKGLFNGNDYLFEGPIYMAILGASLALVVVAIFVYRHGKLNSHRDILSLVVWLIPLSYFISSVNAASTHLAINEVFIKVLWAILFMIGAYYANGKLGSKILQYSIVGVGYVLVMFGFMNWFGNENYKDAVLEGTRLSNVFQYPNTYAAYLIIILICSLIFISVAKKWYLRLIPSIMLLPIMLSLLLTLSRGALLLLPVILVIYFWIIPWHKQIMSLIYLAITGGVSLVVFDKMKTIGKEIHVDKTSSVSTEGWLFLILLSLTIAVVVYVLERYVGKYFLRKYGSKKGIRWSNVIVPILIVASAFGFYLLITYSSSFIQILPIDIQQRIEGLNSKDISLVLRYTFYEDALKIVNDYPYFGGGGGAWGTLYNSYASYPYVSAQAHNFFVQYLVETGWIGLVVFIFFVVYVLFAFIKGLINNRKTEIDESKFLFPIFSLILLGHSAIDFDMSFVYISALVFLCLGATISTENTPFEWLKNIGNKPKNYYLAKVFSAILLIVAVVMIFNLMKAQRANSEFHSARNLLIENQSYNLFAQQLDNSIKLSPRHPGYIALKADVLTQIFKQTNDEKYLQEAMSLLQRVEKREAYNVNVMNLKYRVHFEKREYEPAINVIKAQILHNPWVISFYERAIELYTQLGSQADSELNTEARDRYWNEAMLLFDDLNSRLNDLKTLPHSEQTIRQNFTLTDNILAQINNINEARGQSTE